MIYQEILKSVNYPQEVLVLDFEIYFDQDYSLPKMSTIEYIMDRRFNFTGCGFAESPDFEPIFIYKPDLFWYIKILQENRGKNLENITVVAKNCKFDITILVEKFGIHPPYIVDIDDLLRHYDARMSHKMKDVTSMFGLQLKGDINQFKGLHYEEMDSVTLQALEDYGKNDVEIEAALFTILLPLLSNPSIEIPVARHTLELYLRPIFSVDFDFARELSNKMLSEIQKIKCKTGFTEKQLSGNLSFVKLLQDVLPNNETIPVKPGKPTKKMIKLLGESNVIPAFAKDDAGFQNLLVHQNEKIRNLCEARQAVKSWPLHRKRIRKICEQTIVSSGKLRVPLNYYGGHTGRWSGGEKINLQNLGGRGRAGQGTHPLIQEMRALLQAPSNFILGIADSSQIEARILAWIANQHDLVEGFANNEDIYSKFATELFQTLVYKPKESDPPLIKKMLKIKRGFGKDAILGCGYGMGTNTFFQKCYSNVNLRPYFDSGEYDWDFIDNLIRTYRIKYIKIPEFWKVVEKAFKWVIKYPHEKVGVSDVVDKNMIVQKRRLMFWNNNGTVCIQLPSGRELIYRYCALKHTIKGSQIRWRWGHLWGGSITENIVQAIARDLLAWWILEMERNGLQVVLHSHDEIVCMLAKNDIYGLDNMIKIMRKGPDWAKDLPLDVEGCLSKNYKK